MKKLLILLLLFWHGIAFASEAVFQRGLDVASTGNYSEAFKIWYSLAEQGHAEAQFNLGFMYDEGLGVSQDHEEALQWYQKSAEHGHAAARNNLGKTSHPNFSGHEISQDFISAIEWYRKLAEQGYASAQHNLGFIYGYGEGIYEDRKESVKWYRKSALQGHVAAQINLGAKIGAGVGVKRNWINSYMWATIAKTNGSSNFIVHSSVGFLIDVAKTYMTQEDLDEAQRLVLQCMNSNYKNCP